MREYETTLIIQPEISDEGSQAIRDRLDATLEKNGALRLLWSDLGKRKLAYEIRKFHKGHYYVLHYLDEGRVVPDLERLLRIDESILRFMTVQVNDSVRDIEARKAEARELEIEQQRRAAERAAREAEEASARAEVERVAADEARAREDEEESEDEDASDEDLGSLDDDLENGDLDDEDDEDEDEDEDDEDDDELKAVERGEDS